MKILKWLKDGGPESRVHGLYIVESKKLFSIVLLRFAHGSREAYHSHAFNSVSWLLKGHLTEFEIGGLSRKYTPSLKPIRTPRSMFHRVFSTRTTWVLSFRGPWSSTWKEFLPRENRHQTLTHGRKVVG
jgi:hypothetical protein